MRGTGPPVGGHRVSDVHQDVIKPEEVVRLLGDARAPVPSNPESAYNRLASIMTMIRFFDQFSHTDESSPRNPVAIQLNRAVASLRKTLPEYIEFWRSVEHLPDSPHLDSSKNRLRKLREFSSLLDDLFSMGQNNRRSKTGWYLIGSDELQYRVEAEWHHAALRIFSGYQEFVDPRCRISRDGPAVRFVHNALVRCRVGHFGMDAIEKALTRAMKALGEVSEESHPSTTS
jgi:hypothetical protein